jgi:hypothetical protein
MIYIYRLIVDKVNIMLKMLSKKSVVVVVVACVCISVINEGEKDSMPKKALHSHSLGRKHDNW